MEAAPPPPPRPARLRAALAETPVSWAILAANVAWFVWTSAHGSTLDPDVLVRFGALDPLRVRAGEWWRLASAAFVHVGVLHLATNMLFGLPWCRQLERVARPRRFALLYLASALAGTAASLAGQAALSAGASGAIFGVIGATLALHRRALGSWRAFAASRGARLVAANLVVLALAGLVVPLDQWAHGGGFVCGATMAWLWTRPLPRARLPWVVAAAALAGLVAFALRPGRPPSAYERDEALAAVQRAFEASDVERARAAIAAARAAGLRDPRLDYAGAILLAEDGRLEDALERFRALEASPGRLGEEARAWRGRIALDLADMTFTGTGRRADPAAALGYYDEACRAGVAAGCEVARELRARGAR